MPPARPPRVPPVRRRPSPSSTARAIAAAVAWVFLSLASLAGTVVALWVTLSLGRAASLSGSTATHPLLLWSIALMATIGLPLVLAVWKFQGDVRRLRSTLAWFPAVWNAGGLLLATQFIPDLTAAALHTQGAWMAAERVGDTHTATRVLSALGHHAGDTLATPQPAAAIEPPERAAPELDRSRALTFSFTKEGTVIPVDVILQGPKGRKKLRYLFDTGASYTTISTDVADELGIEIPQDAPTAKLNTAMGPQHSKMVYLPALEIGNVRLEGLVVSVCDGCVSPTEDPTNEHELQSMGLLGQNAMRGFYAQIDFRNQEMTLLPLEEQNSNRAYDIESVVTIAVDGPPLTYLNCIRWTLKVTNHSQVPLSEVTPTVSFPEAPKLFGTKIDRIAPGAVGRSLVDGCLKGPKKSTNKYQPGLAEAHW